MKKYCRYCGKEFYPIARENCCCPECLVNYNTNKTVNEVKVTIEYGTGTGTIIYIVENMCPTYNEPIEQFKARVNEAIDVAYEL